MVLCIYPSMSNRETAPQIRDLARMGGQDLARMGGQNCQLYNFGGVLFFKRDHNIL